MDNNKSLDLNDIAKVFEYNTLQERFRYVKNLDNLSRFEKADLKKDLTIDWILKRLLKE